MIMNDDSQKGSSNKNLEDKVIDLLKDGNIQSIITKLIHNAKWKMIGDILIALLCISAVIVSANFRLIEKGHVSALLSLIIGAVIGARFKSS